MVLSQSSRLFAFLLGYLRGALSFSRVIKHLPRFAGRIRSSELRALLRCTRRLLRQQQRFRRDRLTYYVSTSRTPTRYIAPLFSSAKCPGPAQLTTLARFNFHPPVKTTSPQTKVTWKYLATTFALCYYVGTLTNAASNPWQRCIPWKRFDCQVWQVVQCCELLVIIWWKLILKTFTWHTLNWASLRVLCPVQTYLLLVKESNLKQGLTSFCVNFFKDIIRDE